jgi:hypothetical protein
MKKNLTYWTLILLTTYGLTFGIEYLVRPLWFIKGEEHTYLATFQAFFTIILLPIALVTIAYLLTKKFDKRKWFWLPSIIICSCIYISAQLGFINWADSIGSRQNPDNETLLVVAFEWQVGLIMTFIGLTICFVRFYRNRKTVLR